MTAVGLITEYNPFHNGHYHHLRESLRISGAEVAVAVMSGNFLQRGMPAMLDKWTRTEMALASGVDVVLELPVVWACNSAPHFASGAVATLDACGGVSSLCFGSERGEIAPLLNCADALTSSAEMISKAAGEALRSGISYPAARAAAMQRDPENSDLLKTPNNILGVTYLQALAAAGSPLRPLTIPRIGAGYHDCEVKGSIASATALRHLHCEKGDLSPFIPPLSFQRMQQAIQQGNIVDDSLTFRALAARLNYEPESLASIYQVEDGLAERLCRVACSVQTLSELIDAVKVRHLTVSRIQRILIYILLDLTKRDVEEQLINGPSYLRLLGATARGERFLAASRKKRTLPILGNLSRAAAQLKKYYGEGSPDYCRASHLLRLETRATRLFTFLLSRWSGRERNRDYYEGVRRCQ